MHYSSHVSHQSISFVWFSFSAAFVLLCCIGFKYSFTFIQEMQRETPSYEALLHGLVNLGLCLYPTASEARTQELSDELIQMQERCASLKNSISRRQLTFYTLLYRSFTFITSELMDSGIFISCCPMLFVLFKYPLVECHIFISSTLFSTSLLDLSCWSLSWSSWSSLIRHC